MEFIENERKWYLKVRRNMEELTVTQEDMQRKEKKRKGARPICLTIQQNKKKNKKPTGLK